MNAPLHYRKSPSGVECIDITEHMNFCVGNAVKYLWRAGEKNDLLEDLKKARWYVDREIARVEKERGWDPYFIEENDYNIGAFDIGRLNAAKQVFIRLAGGEGQRIIKSAEPSDAMNCEKNLAFISGRRER